MLDLALLRGARIGPPRPLAQRLVMPLLTLDYLRPPRTEIIVEGLDHIPQDRGIFLAMNHTDRFSYGPLLWHMHRLGLPRYVATWVKGKYFHNALMRRFLLWTGNIPVPSRGELIEGTFRERLRRAPEAAEYRLLRDLLDEKQPPEAVSLSRSAYGEGVAAYLEGWGGAARFVSAAAAQFEAQMEEVMRLHREALGPGQRHVLVFPEGTRSPQMIAGKTGLVEVTQHLGAAIVPIACIGGDDIYPGNVPLSKGGRVVYRIGAPLAVDGPALAPHRVTTPFVPFTRAASRLHGDRFRAATGVVMDHIHDMLPPRYQRKNDASG